MRQNPLSEHGVLSVILENDRFRKRPWLPTAEQNATHTIDASEPGLRFPVIPSPEPPFESKMESCSPTWLARGLKLRLETISRHCEAHSSTGA